jgi:GT2 family glycosyltransferase
MSLDLTVHVAACGNVDALRRCLAGLRAQSVAPMEVVVVDQAPSDSARAVVSAAGLEGARYVEQERLGLSASRNLALRSASGSLLAVTDDDCVPDPAWAEAVVAAARRSPAPAAVTGPILPLGDGAPGMFAISLRDSPTPADHSGRILPWGIGSGANFAAPVGDLRRLGGWDERLGAGTPGQAGEDSDLIYRMLREGGIVRYTPAAVVRHAWQTRERRLRTRWTYGYGLGAMCGIWLRRGDPFVMSMVAGYARLHVRPLLEALRRRDRFATQERVRAAGSLLPGLVHGVLLESRAHTAPRSD